MPTRIAVALLIFTVVLGLGAVPSISSSNKQEFLSVKDTSIVDSSGRVLILRGVNYPGYQYSAWDLTLHKESVYAMFARVGFNVVRLPISWGNLEPWPGVFYDTYLRDYVDRDVRWAKEHGLYVVLDMHQTNWAERFGGYGAPDWAVSQYPPTQLGMRDAISHFWNDTELQDHLVDVWTKIARRYANEPTIAGFDILNEPWIYTSVIPSLNSSHLNSFYKNVIDAIKTVDQNHLIFLEPANLQGFQLPWKESVVWSPHFYTLSYAKHYDPSSASVLEADLAAKYQRFVVEMASPMWIGEFGAFMRDGSSDEWLKDALRAFDKYQLGWAWWAFGSKFGSKIPAILSATLASAVEANKTTSAVGQQIQSVSSAVTPIETHETVGVFNLVLPLLFAVALVSASEVYLIRERRHRRQE